MISPSGKSRIEAISFGERLAASDRFEGLFREGMALVEETAAYLDGEGRDEARHLPRMAALSYASESMRLTTRLMQIASWLLLQRAVNEGEMTQAEALADKGRAVTSWKQDARVAGARGEGVVQSDSSLPAKLVGLVDRSFSLKDRIAHLESLITNRARGGSFQPARPPLEDQLERLRTAFSA